MIEDGKTNDLEQEIYGKANYSSSNCIKHKMSISSVVFVVEKVKFLVYVRKTPQFKKKYCVPQKYRFDLGFTSKSPGLIATVQREDTPNQKAKKISCDVNGRCPKVRFFERKNLVLPEQSKSKTNCEPTKFKYKSGLKIVQTKMYEPVSDGCVTYINSKYGNKITYDQSDVEEDCTNCVYEDCNKINEQPPEKPPRRSKIQSSFDCAVFNRRNCDKMRTGNVDNYIDVDHITLESERNYKNRFHSIGVQTSTLLPYRLRFFPKFHSDIDCVAPSGSSFINKLCFCGKTLSQCLFSQVGLTFILVNWALLGAAAFYKTEGPREQQQTKDLETVQKELSIDLATDLRQVSQHSEIWPQTVQKYMARYEDLLLSAVGLGYGEGGEGFIWTYPGCILFSVSLLTTLGFGAPVPRTSLGRGAAVLFAAIGIPLHFLLILNVGNLIAGKLQILVNRCTKTSSPADNDSIIPRKGLIKWFPLVSILLYYSLGAILFGIVRERNIADSLLFPLDFTPAGGVAKTSGHVRIFYALYLEFAVVLAATIVSIIQTSATRGIVDLGLKLGLLTNT
ncbi:hypothetical protein FQR65_LT10107 [Abscondita terminalis]|nr:hypothetical protein FQR65_LT10107 [Abscondita terminalis]